MNIGQILQVDILIYSFHWTMSCELNCTMYNFACTTSPVAKQKLFFVSLFSNAYIHSLKHEMDLIQKHLIFHKRSRSNFELQNSEISAYGKNSFNQQDWKNYMGSVFA